MRTSLLIVVAAAVCAACSSESSSVPRNNAVNGAICVAGATQTCTCTTGSGMQSCSPAGMWNPCACTGPMTPIDVGNPDDMTPAIDAGMTMVPTGGGGIENCSPGFYLGTYECEISLFGLPVPLAGDVSFNLSINETTVDQECPPGEEFCADLVISENGGTLFGLAGFIGFETMLAGALDCSTGEFRAMGIQGRWGNAISTDPNNPDALWTVEEPPQGMFDGVLMGMHSKTADETISGTWDLTETAMDITCAGPFTVTLQP